MSPTWATDCTIGAATGVVGAGAPGTPGAGAKGAGTGPLLVHWLVLVQQGLLLVCVLVLVLVHWLVLVLLRVLVLVLVHWLVLAGVGACAAGAGGTITSAAGISCCLLVPAAVGATIGTPAAA